MATGKIERVKGKRLRETMSLPTPSEATKTRGKSLLLLPTPWRRHHARVRDPSCRPTQHPSHRDAAIGFDLLQPSHFTLNWLKYLIYPSKSQNLCLWGLCFSESMLVFFIFWLCDCVFVSLWYVTMIVTISLILYRKESVESLGTWENIRVWLFVVWYLCNKIRTSHNNRKSDSTFKKLKW